MIVTICGSRGIYGDAFIAVIDKAVKLSQIEVTKVIHGDERRSIDAVAEAWAINNNIPFEAVPADWKGMAAKGIPKEAAGPIRNKVMCDKSEAVIAIWDGKSTGTQGCFNLFRRAKKAGFVYRLDDEARHERFGFQLTLFGEVDTPRKRGRKTR